MVPASLDEATCRCRAKKSRWQTSRLLITLFHEPSSCIPSRPMPIWSIGSLRFAPVKPLLPRGHDPNGASRMGSFNHTVFVVEEYAKVPALTIFAPIKWLRRPRRNCGYMRPPGIRVLGVATANLPTRLEYLELAASRAPLQIQLWVGSSNPAGRFNLWQRSSAFATVGPLPGAFLILNWLRGRSGDVAVRCKDTHLRAAELLPLQPTTSIGLTHGRNTSNDNSSPSFPPPTQNSSCYRVRQRDLALRAIALAQRSPTVGCHGKRRAAPKQAATIV